jgi:hypothetical protein
VTAGREDWTTGARGQLRTSRAERERAIDMLKGAFIQGRLAKDEFDQRAGQVFASRTYAELGALTADIPDGVTSALLPTGHTREPDKALSFKTAARVGAVGAIPSVASATVVLMQSSGVPAVVGLLFVGLTGIFAAGLVTALLIVMSWAVRRSQRRRAQRPPSSPAGLAAKRQVSARQLPSAGHDLWRAAEAIRSRLARLQVSPVQCCGGVLARGSC